MREKNERERRPGVELLFCGLNEKELMIYTLSEFHYVSNINGA